MGELMLDRFCPKTALAARPNQPFVAFRKNRLRIRRSRSKVRTLFAMFAQKVHKEDFRPCQPHATSPITAKPRSQCATRARSRVARTKDATPSTDLSPPTGGRSPDLPRKRECPRTLCRGHFFCAFAGSSMKFTRRHGWRRATRLPLRKRRQCGGHCDWQQRYGFQSVRCARLCRGVCRCQHAVGSSIAALAQLVRAPAYEAGGRGFESRMPRHWIAQLGRASVL